MIGQKARREKRERRRFWGPVAAGFGAMYVLTMGLSTYLVKERFVEDYRRQFEAAAASISREASQKEFDMEGREWDEGARKDFYQSVADRSCWAVPGGAFDISVAFYDEEMELLARSREQAGGNSARSGSGVKREYMSFGLEDYLTQEEKEQLAEYRWKYIQEAQTGDLTPNPWRFCIRVSPDEEDLWAIYVQQITWQAGDDGEQEAYRDPLTQSIWSVESGVTVDYGTGQELSGGETYWETDSQVVWQWVNPEVDDETRKTGAVSGTNITFPYMDIYENGSYNRWKRWSASAYLQDYPRRGEFSWETGPEEPPLRAADGLVYRAGYKLQLGMAGAPFSYMEIRMESRPWPDALNYMKYVYVAGLALMAASVFKISSAFGKIYDRQKALEGTRRDFTNAMAHELKTPLGIIRNFAENLLEHNMEEKRDYYLRQIIGQTEEMDRLVLKMIEVSKLDSEQLVLKREPVSFGELLREEAARLEPVLLEKQIRIEYEEAGDFAAEGDREYLARAVWNLLANAAEYNRPGGSIRIRTQKDRCVIENTGEPMEEEDLRRAFEMFYTVDKSRDKKAGHMGMGLFLAKKILELHHLELEIKNIDTGVQAVIKGGGRPSLLSESREKFFYF